MANLNLSEFGEKLFVADADHTFIWDTANAISKRVSRNSWLNSGTLTSDAPVTISQTWNGTGSTVFTAFKVNATSTASDPTSKLLDLQVGSASIFNIDRLGRLNFYNTDSTPALAFSLAQYTNTSLSITRTGVLRAVMGAAGYICSSTGVIGFSSGTDANSLDTILLRDGAANTLALRNGVAAQTFNVYGTWTTAITNFERLAIKYNTTDLAYQIAAEKGTTNGDYRPLQLWTGGASRLHITTAGNVGIGTTSPTSKLQVAAGDVEVDTIAKGVILKSPDGTRYRVTVANGGTLSVAAV